MKVNSIQPDNTGWSAAERVFGGDIKHLLCHWHVDQ